MVMSPKMGYGIPTPNSNGGDLPSSVEVSNDTGEPLPSLLMNSLVPLAFDAVDLDPPILPTTIRFFVGGLGGTLVRTLTLTYSGEDIETVVAS